MSKAVILQHVDYEGPGRIVPLFRDNSIRTEVRRLDKGDEVPADLDDIRVLVVMGGPMGITDIGSEKHPFLAKEVELLKRVIAADRAFLGICLGAQLLAHAAGAKVYPNAKPGATQEDPKTPMPELGWGPVTFPFPGGTEPIVMGMRDGAPMFHWHFHTFDLPRLPAPANAPPPPAPPPPSGNSLLSSTRACKNQAFRFKTRLFGFQYHMELTEPDIEGILAHCKNDLTKVSGADGERKIREDTKKFYREYERLSQRLLNNFVQFLRLY
jgi:GMP synthase (glutamine-hydrolysing)